MRWALHGSARGHGLAALRPRGRDTAAALALGIAEALRRYRVPNSGRPNRPAP
jgi:hypothetical protein